MFVFLKGLLSGLQGYLIVAIVTGLAGTAGGYYAAHKAGQAALNALLLRESTAKVEAVKDAALEQKRIDHIGVDAALALAATTLNIEVGSVKLITEIERHVTVKSIACVPWGFVRVLDAAVLGRSAESLNLPAGVSDDTCSGIDAVVLAGRISANYAAARTNAAQLDALSATVRQVSAVP